MKKIIHLTLIALLSACATQPDKMAASDVSPYEYKDYSCDMIQEEKARVSRRTNELYTQLKKTADNDAMQMGAGMILLWPMLFTLEGGDGPQAVEYQNLKGKYNALQEVSTKKRCNIEFNDFTKTQQASVRDPETLAPKKK